jgi:hypothetical protein
MKTKTAVNIITANLFINFLPQVPVNKTGWFVASSGQNAPGCKQPEI